MLYDWTRVRDIKNIPLKDLIEMFNDEDIAYISEMLREGENPIFVEDPEYDPAPNEEEPTIPEKEEEVSIVQVVHGRLFDELMTIRREENTEYGWIETDKLG